MGKKIHHEKSQRRNLFNLHPCLYYFSFHGGHFIKECIQQERSLPFLSLCDNFPWWLKTDPKAADCFRVQVRFNRGPFAYRVSQSKKRYNWDISIINGIPEVAQFFLYTFFDSMSPNIGFYKKCCDSLVFVFSERT